MFDFDREGERKTRFFEAEFYRADENADARIRKEVGKLFRVRTIEELGSAHERLLEEVGIRQEQK